MHHYTALRDHLEIQQLAPVLDSTHLRPIPEAVVPFFHPREISFFIFDAVQCHTKLNYYGR